MTISATDLDTLARTIWGEARGETPIGQRSVAHVIINRVKDRRWPNTIAEVCKQPLQFSCWNANDPNRAKIDRVDYTDRGLRSALASALMAVSDDARGDDPTGGADHYLANYLIDDEGRAPGWAREMDITRRVGGHTFLKAV